MEDDREAEPGHERADREAEQHLLERDPGVSASSERSSQRELAMSLGAGTRKSWMLRAFGDPVPARGELPGAQQERGSPRPAPGTCARRSSRRPREAAERPLPQRGERRRGHGGGAVGGPRSRSISIRSATVAGRELRTRTRSER